MKKLSFLAVIFLLVSILGLAACGSGASPIENTTWVLQSYGEPEMTKLPLPHIQITVYFDSGSKEFTGDAGCNTYSGSYEVNEDSVSFTGPVAITEMWCGDDVAQQETEYMQLFNEADSFEVDNHELRLNCGHKVIVYHKK